ncbi:MAG: molecular chaperone HtpG [Gammaproteobacteria bacterium 28-57-27]|nr:MAG: molecular chaperone HtpG [Gammaproteobacteria bacterium 28-57-27]
MHNQTETLEFQTEVRQLLHLMIHSLYSNPEIFLRELVSNASDACDKLRYEALGDAALYENDAELRIEVSVDKDARTLTLRDNGVGMNRQEVIENLGTIARSGTKQFLETLSGDKARDTQLIGQFGVGFYSAFIVADKVDVLTRRAGLGAEHGVHWSSEGTGAYTLENIERAPRGTEIVLHLKADQDKFLEPWQLRNIIKRYSEHITFPIMMAKDSPEGEVAEAGMERVNEATALWARAKSEIKDEEYNEFYQQAFHDWEAPLAWTHNRVEGRTEYTNLIYIPARAPFDLWDRDAKHGIKLYVRRVFIMDDAERLLPRYLRFVRGVVDSADLPLNVSREILQSSEVLNQIRQGLAKRVLNLLEELAIDKPDVYAKLWGLYARVIKEGFAEDTANRDVLARLLRFASTHTESHGQDVSLANYVARMPEGQDAIYVLTAENDHAARHSPHIEAFKARGFEVLLLSDAVDEWMLSHLQEFDGKSIKSVAREDALPESEKPTPDEAQTDVLQRIEKALEGKVKAVRASTRLVDSPACVVLSAHELPQHLRRLYREAGQPLPESLPILEVNLSHALVQRIQAESDAARVQDWSGLLLGMALLAEGAQLDDGAAFVQQLNRLFI